MCKFIGKIRQIKPFVGKIRQTKPFVGKFLENYKFPVPVYDNAFPIEWNSVEVAKAANSTVDKFIKISNLTPTVAEMESLVITFVQDGETIELPYSHTNEGTYLYTDESVTAVVQLRVLDDGLYAGNYGSVDWSGEIWDADFTASIVEEPVVPDTPTGIYDDEFPIEWNSLAVQGNAMGTIRGMSTADLPKVSNLVPTTAELISMQGTLSIGSNAYNLANDGELVDLAGLPTAMLFNADVADTDGTNRLFAVSLIPLESEREITVDGDTLYFPEAGLYVFIQNYTNYTDYDISLTPPVTATHYLYGREAEATVTYNGVELPDIESVWTDKGKYPYAVTWKILTDSEAGTYETYLYLTNDKFATNGVAIYNPTVVAISGYSPNGSEWEFGAESSMAANAIALPLSHLSDLWANYDILNTDGSVYLAASDPVKSYPDATVIVDGVGYYGAVLPNIDEVWTDKETYPYGTLSVNGSWTGLVCYSKKLYLSDGYFYQSEAYEAAYWSLVDGAWVSQGSGSGNAGDNLGPEGPLFWTSHDILNTDGSVYLASSDPIPVTSLVGYSYNGTVLPELPEWDKSVYPYAYIDYWYSGEYVLYLMQNPTITRNDTHDWVYFKVGENIRFILQNGDDTWTPYKSSSITSTVFVYKSGALDCCVWSNFDIEHNSVMYLAASDPIPVYE